MNIILIGFMGSGKSSVAKRLASLLGFSLLEMDALALQKTASKSMFELFTIGGELLLRETEIAIAQEIASKPNQVISTGGGVILNKMILELFKKYGGQLFFLHVPFETIAHRLAKDEERPLFRNRLEAEALYHFRQPLYVKYADHVIKVDKQSVEEIAQEIAKKWEVIHSGQSLKSLPGVSLTANQWEL